MTRLRQDRLVFCHALNPSSFTVSVPIPQEWYGCSQEPGLGFEINPEKADSVFSQNRRVKSCTFPTELDQAFLSWMGLLIQGKKPLRTAAVT